MSGPFKIDRLAAHERVSTQHPAWTSIYVRCLQSRAGTAQQGLGRPADGDVLVHPPVGSRWN